MIQKAGVKGSVMRHQHGVVDKFQPARRDLSKDWRLSDHVVRDAGQRSHEARDRQLGIDERYEFINNAAGAHTIGAQLDKSVGWGFSPGGFDVDDNEVEFVERLDLNVRAQQLDCLAVESLEAMIVSHEIGNQQAGKLGIDM